MRRRRRTPPAPTFRPLDDGAQPARPPARGRPVPRLGVQDPDRSCSTGCSTRSSSARRPPTPPTPLAAIADERPDLVVSRSSPSAPWSAPRRPALPFDVLFPNPYLLPAPGMPPFGLGLQPGHRRARPAARPRPQRLHRPAVGQGPARPQRAAGRPRPRPRWPPSSTRSAAPAGSSCSPRPTSTSRPSCPANVRYVGPVLDDPAWAGAAVDGAARRRPARARRAVVHVPGPRRLPAADRRRPRHPAGARPRHHRPGPRPRRDHRAGQRARRAGGARTPRCCGRPPPS